jgi:hypothetical protein
MSDNTVDNKQLACYGIDGVMSNLGNLAKKLGNLSNELGELHISTHPEGRKISIQKLKEASALLLRQYELLEMDTVAYNKFLEMFDNN